MFHLLTKRTAWFLPPMTCFSSKAEEIQSAVIAKCTKLLKANKTTSANPFDKRILDCITELKVPLYMINVFKSLSGNVFQQIKHFPASLEHQNKPLKISFCFLLGRNFSSTSAIVWRIWRRRFKCKIVWYDTLCYTNKTLNKVTMAALIPCSKAPHEE